MPHRSPRAASPRRAVRLAAALTLGVSVHALPATAQEIAVDPQDIQALQARIDAMQIELERLEAQNGGNGGLPAIEPAAGPDEGLMSKPQRGTRSAAANGIDAGANGNGIQGRPLPGDIAPAAGPNGAAATDRELAASAPTPQRVPGTARQGQQVAQSGAATDPREIERGLVQNTAPVEVSGDPLRVVLSGQANRALLFGYDGEDVEVFSVDNDASSTRLNLTAEGAPLAGRDDYLIGAEIEVEFQSNPSNLVNQEDKEAGGDGFDERKLEIYAETPFGNIALGQGNTASNGIAEVDLTGTGLAGSSAIGDLAGGLLFRNDDGDLTATVINDVFSNLDGLSREDRIRYDSPDLLGNDEVALTASTSFANEGDGDQYDVALRFNGNYDSGLEVRAALGYFDDDSDNATDYGVSGSTSVRLASGLVGTFAGGFEERDDEAEEPWFAYGKIGYLLPAPGGRRVFGDAAVSLDYYYGEDIDQEGDEAMALGVQFAQDLQPVMQQLPVSTELFVGGRYHDLERDGADLDSIIAVMTGARVRF